MKKTCFMAAFAIFMAALSIFMLISGNGRTSIRLSRTGKCEECGQTEKLNHYISKNTNRDEWVCNTCYNACKLFGM